ncbi:uncharacterized protein LOC122004230 [Zingiber officinale]|uniref:uncharacterized protein LOC122004230 n=1 Tax=Zingiber officinale TaxID=94328 RepID=UPI001C4A8E11|nr:uncharacterized protein LOC122004230 [Zingiber officinale]
MRLSVKNLVFFFAVVFSCPSGFPSPSSPSSIFRFLIREKETTIGKKDSGEEEEKMTTTREWGIALVHLQDLPLLQSPHRRSTSRTSGSETTTGKLSNLSNSTTLGESSGNDISVEKVFPEGRILEVPNLRVYTFVKLRSSTRNFKPESVLGEGGFGKVYKGWVEEKTLNPSKSGVGTLVAVKKLNPESVHWLEEWQFTNLKYSRVEIDEVRFEWSLAEQEVVTLPATTASEQEPATEVVLDTTPEKSERVATDTVLMAETASDTYHVAGTAADTAPEADNEIPEWSSGGEHSAVGHAKVGLFALLDKFRTDWTVLHDQTLQKSYAESSVDNRDSDAQAVLLGTPYVLGAQVSLVSYTRQAQVAVVPSTP